MPESIQEVIYELDSIIDQAWQSQSALGYFPALYRRVTLIVEDHIDREQFADNDRMEALLVVFANRYISAFDSFLSNAPVTRSWQSAFQQAGNQRLTTLQHLLLGMNAHISLDLGIAANAVSPSGDLLSSKGDFHKINAILGSLIEDTQGRLTRIFGPLGLVDRLLGNIDEAFSLFSISYARDKAWTQALELSVSNPSQQEKIILERDEAVARFSEHLTRPPKWWQHCLLLAIRLLERGDVRSRIEILRDDSNPSQ